MKNAQASITNDGMRFTVWVKFVGNLLNHREPFDVKFNEQLDAEQFADMICENIHPTGNGGPDQIWVDSRGGFLRVSHAVCMAAQRYGV